MLLIISYICTGKEVGSRSEAGRREKQEGRGRRARTGGEEREPVWDNLRDWRKPALKCS